MAFSLNLIGLNINWAAQPELAMKQNRPRMEPRIHEWTTGIRVFVKNSWTVL